MSPNPITVRVGATQAFTATALDTDGATKPVCASWDTNAGEMTGSALLARLRPAAGLQVTATLAQLSATALVNVSAGPLATIIVHPNPVDVIAGQAQAFVASGTDSFANTVPVSPTWSSDAGSMSGNVLLAQTAAARGKHVVVSSHNVVGTATVNVVAGPMTGIVVAPSAVTIPVGTAHLFLAVGVDRFANAILIAPRWTSDVGQVQLGMLIAQPRPNSHGHVTATVDAISASAMVNVVPGTLTAISVTPRSLTLPTGGSWHFKAAGLDAYSNTIPGLAFTWRVAQPTVGAIDARGVFTAGVTPADYPAAVIAVSDTVVGTADVHVRWPKPSYLPQILR